MPDESCAHLSAIGSSARAAASDRRGAIASVRLDGLLDQMEGGVTAANLCIRPYNLPLSLRFLCIGSSASGKLEHGILGGYDLGQDYPALFGRTRRP